jgi:hypothetical protein
MKIIIKLFEGNGALSHFLNGFPPMRSLLFHGDITYSIEKLGATT